MYDLITIRDVAPITGWEIDPKSDISNDTFQMRCHECDDRGYHINVDCNKNEFHCIRCGFGGGALRLYTKACHNEDLRPGTEQAKEMFRHMREDLGKTLNYPPKQQLSKKIIGNEYKKIECASDDVLDKTYSTLLEFPHFKLSKKDRESLLGRGLSEDAIERNGYRSIDYRFRWINDYPDFKKAYEQMGKSSKYDAAIIAGMILASYLEDRGCTLCGCPGFYKLGTYWAYNLSSGILIPTRNLKGQIVCFQVRTNSSKCRYLTVSSKNLPEGVTESFTRIHFPLGNSILHPGTKVYLTEGPLKSDVAVDLMKGEDRFFAAILGVNHRKHLPEFFDYLFSQGIHEIHNALDMDKVTNINVFRQSNIINKMAVESNIRVLMLYWDRKCCERKFHELLDIASEYKIQFDGIRNNVYLNTVLLTIALDQAGITPPITYWDQKSKGIDDFLLQTVGINHC